MAWTNNNGQIRVGVRQTLINNQSQILYSLVTSGLSLNLDSSNSQSYSGSGVTWTDLTGNGNNGVLTGGVSYNSGLITLDGVDDYIEFDNNNLLYNAWGGEFTQEFSIRLKGNAPSLKTIFRVDDWSRISISISTSQIVFKIGYDNGSTQSDTLNVNYQFNYNQWYVIGIVWSKLNTQKIYVNGLLVGQRTPTLSNYAGVLSTSGGANIGRGHSSPYTNNINCDISTFRHYNRVLSDSEILENYNFIKSRFGHSVSTPILDTYSGSLAAYSLRKLKTGATSSVRVRRSSDNSEQNIGFNSIGELDTSALLSFVGSGNGFVKTLYDQSGSGLNMTQTTAARQPQIVSSGVLITSEGRVAMQYDGLDDYMINFNSNFSGEDKSITTVNVVDVLTAKYSEILSMGYSSSGTGLEFFTNLILGSATQYYAGKRDNGGNIKTTSFGVVTTGIQLLTSYSSGTTNNARKNGSLILSNYDVNVGNITIDNISIGALVRNGIGGYSNIKSMEVIIYPSDKSSSISGIENAINSYYNLWGGISGDGLVLNLDANKTTSYIGTGTNWVDISGNGNNGVLVGSIAYSPSNSGVMVLDGIDDYINCGTLGNFGSSLSSNSITMEFAFKSSYTAGIRQFGTINSGSSTLLAINFNRDENDNYSSGKTTFSLRDNNGLTLGVSMNTNIYTNNYFVVTVSRNISTNVVKFYVNGVPVNVTVGGVGFNSNPVTFSNFQYPFAIGALNNRGNIVNYINSSIPFFRMYNTLLTDAEVLRNFNALKSRFGL
jgi:hypothetical protein